MDYPVWQIAATGGGFWIALIATVHVFVAHFAVGGGLFLVLTEAKGHRENSPAILDYVKSHTTFFLLLTMVFGGLSGVAIWFTIAVLSPGGTLTLVNAFVWGWAMEWTFFLGEIAALLVYHYSFGKMAARDHMRVGWLYFIFAWLSLFTINGIIGVMLTPGAWATSNDFWDGMFNPSFWPSLVFRSFLAFMLAGLFGFVTAVRVRDAAARERVVRTCVAWAVISLPFLALSGWWYLSVLPQATLDFILRGSAEITPYLKALPVIAVAVGVFALLMAVRLPLSVRTPVAALLLVLGFGVVGAFEYIREAGRRPFIIQERMWSTGITPAQAEPLADPFLPRTKWAKNKEITQENRLDAGREIYAFQCLSCHSLSGPMKDIRTYTGHIGNQGVAAYLTGQGRLFKQMPPFVGSPAERDALAAYITAGVNGRPLDKPVVADIKTLPLDIPPFDADTASHLLLSWCTLGLKCITDADGFFTFLPPGSAVGAVLIRRDVLPEVVADGVEITYAAPEGFKHPSKHVDFWKYAPSLIGKEPKPDQSPAGKGLDGTLAFNEKSKTFEAAGIPVVPFSDDGSINPYPLFTITATDKATGTVLARTKTVLPVSTEMSCWKCHGGAFRKDGVTGISNITAAGILAVHDKRSGTDLAAKAAAGQPVMCQSCHPDALFDATADPKRLNLSAAMHGFHVNYMTGRGEDACADCHPDSHTGVTRCLRDNHAAKGIGCASCHGYLEDHALSLLRAEQAAGKERAGIFMRNITPRLVPQTADITPRLAWVQEPDCLTCHTDFATAQKDAKAFNVWVKDRAGLYRSRKEDTGNVPCIACHGAPHATYVANNAYGKDRDNVQPIQYMGFAGVIGSKGRCDVCHTVEMEGGEMHHPNMVKE
ncbi:cytochrome c family protein [hydrocarbon metagenome]|uniref:Cytochrome c family protein n=1 Tax=hydrocarbon metagenome TaxID=938273 RepID=A0A0W8G412_9ZZZZ